MDPLPECSEPERLSAAVEAAAAAGAILREYFGGETKIRHKGEVDIVSEADVRAEESIVQLLTNRFADDAILAEESSPSVTDGDHLWIVDPLDGTTNFVHGIPHVAISIAYYHAGTPVLGVVHNPIRDDWYQCARGVGAWANGERVCCNADATLAHSLVGVGFYYDRGGMMRATLAALEELFGRQIHGIRRFGTAALDLCHVGMGHFSAFFEYQLSPWDFAAGRLFVEEAGGTVTTCGGDPLPMQPTSVLATNAHLHAEVQEIVRRHLPAD